MQKPISREGRGWSDVSAEETEDLQSCVKSTGTVYMHQMT